MDRIHLQQLYLWDFTIFFYFLNSFKVFIALMGAAAAGTLQSWHCGIRKQDFIPSGMQQHWSSFLMECLGWRVVLLLPRGPVSASASPILFLMKGVTSQEATVSPLLPPFCFSLGGVWLTGGAALVAAALGAPTLTSTSRVCGSAPGFGLLNEVDGPLVDVRSRWSGSWVAFQKPAFVCVCD